MKLTSLVRRSLVGVACMSCVLCTTAQAGEKYESMKAKHSRQEAEARAEAMKPRVILVSVTGSRIPQRVVLRGTQVDSASPLFVIQGNDLLRSGATTVSGILAIDPSISFGGRIR